LLTQLEQCETDAKDYALVAGCPETDRKTDGTPPRFKRKRKKRDKKEKKNRTDAFTLRPIPRGWHPEGRAKKIKVTAL